MKLKKIFALSLIFIKITYSSEIQKIKKTHIELAIKFEDMENVRSKLENLGIKILNYFYAVDWDKAFFTIEFDQPKTIKEIQCLLAKEGIDCDKNVKKPKCECKEL